MRRDENFAPVAVTWFLRVFGLAVVVDVLTELASGVWHVHTGELYPWRYLGILPLYPARGLAIEWTLRVLGGAALLAFPKRARVVGPAVRVLATVLFIACVERYSNHGALLFLVAIFTSLAPPDVTREDFADVPHPALGLVRAQLVIVYLFSALNKLTHGFANGESLTNLTHASLGALAKPLSWAVLAMEIALPLVVIRYPRPGIALVALVHVAFAIVVPGVWSFGLVMVAMSMLWLTSPAEGSASSSRR